MPLSFGDFDKATRGLRLLDQPPIETNAVDAHHDDVADNRRRELLVTCHLGSGERPRTIALMPSSAQGPDPRTSRCGQKQSRGRLDRARGDL